MKTFNLSFGVVTILREDIAEVIVDDSVELSSEMVDEYQNFLISNLRPPFSVLVNRLNKYSYDFDAQLKLGDSDQFHAFAIVTYCSSSEAIYRAVATLPRNNSWNYRMFVNRIDALDWLISEQNMVHAQSNLNAG